MKGWLRGDALRPAAELDGSAAVAARFVHAEGVIAVPGVLPVALAYDAHGRLETVTQGARTLARTYGQDGFLDSITDPLAQVRTFEVDAVGRVLSETQPDNEQVQYGHDAVGNQTSVTPPGQPAHVLGYTPVDLVQSYDPPALPTGPTPTSWSYDDDHKLATITKPGGTLVSFGYDTAGRPEGATFPGGWRARRA